MRPRHGRVLCGVCRGISLHLGIRVTWIRLLMLALLPAFGIGAIAYVLLWISVPAGDPMAAVQAAMSPGGRQPLARGNAPVTDDGEAGVPGPAFGAEDLTDVFRSASKPALLIAAGSLLLTIALILMARGLPSHLIAPAILLGAGLAVAWLRFDDGARHASTLALAAGLILAALASYVFPTFPSREAWQMMALALAVLAAVAVMLTPWAHALLLRLSSEQAGKERQEERADMAAHLHDGVLQTLALIQLNADDPQTVFTLARGQERDLRNWLYQERAPTERSVSSGLKEIAAEVEDAHGKPIDVVTVGDALPSAQTDALLNATRQALVNAVTHGGEPISAYCETGKGKVEVFVRDHGDGFDPESIPPDRLGIRQSIIGRIERRGGTVEIVSRPRWGTEVRMHMPISATSDQGNAMQSSQKGQRKRAQDGQTAGRGTKTK
ncbi:ATP-binding protein [Bifidobacterium xylocopae]|uniref:Histidine kinase n=1 Tax=Bifidobacterium xylocopae TaxID=2493119 RepID=A0A366KDV1_9BIFI|nr:histidine kinase [Bifidobacterium xylocopae]